MTYKLTVCAYCRTKFKHDPNQQRKFCSRSCSTTMKNKLQIRPKKKKVIKKKFIGVRWGDYHKGLIPLTEIKKLMTLQDKYRV